jgi:WD40 repeat protein
MSATSSTHIAIGRLVSIPLLLILLVLNTPGQCQPLARPPVAQGAHLVANVGHASAVHTAALSSNQAFIVTGSDDGTAKLWDVASERQLGTFHASSKAIYTVALSNNCQFLLTAGADAVIRLWRLRTGQVIRGFQGHMAAVTAVVFTHDSSRLVSCSTDKTVRLWDAATGKCLRVFQGHTDSVTSVALTPDGSAAVTGSCDRTARIWDIASGKLSGCLRGHSGGINAVAISMDGRYVATASDDETVCLWNLQTGTMIRRYKETGQGVNVVGLSADGQWLLTAGSECDACIWNLSTAEKVRLLRGHDGAVVAAKFSNDDKIILTASTDRTVRLWESATGKETARFQGHVARQWSISVSGDDKKLLAIGWPYSIVWNLCDGQPCFIWHTRDAPIKCAGLSADGNAIVASDDDGTIRVVDIANRREVITLPAKERDVMSVILSGDSTRVAVCCRNGVRLWDRTRVPPVCVFRIDRDDIACCDLSEDGRSMVTGNRDDTVSVWHIPAGHLVNRFYGHKGPITAATLMPDGKHIVTGGRDGTVRWWEIATGVEVRRIVADKMGVISLRRSADGTRLITQGLEAVPRLWDFETGAMRCQFQGPFCRLESSAVLSGDGERVFILRRDSTIGLWDTTTRTELCRIVAFGDQSWVIRDAHGRFDTSIDRPGRGFYWVKGDRFLENKDVRDFGFEPGLLGKYFARNGGRGGCSDTVGR